MGYLRNGGRKRNEIFHKGGLGDENDAQTSNTRMAQRKRAIPHSATRTGKQTSAYPSDLDDGSHVTCSLVCYCSFFTC